jgi:hypothetical protein
VFIARWIGCPGRVCSIKSQRLGSSVKALLPGVDFSPERALSHDSRSAKSQAADVMATIVAEVIDDHLQAANFVAMRRPGREHAFATVAEHNSHHLTVAVRWQFPC